MAESLTESARKDKQRNRSEGSPITPAYIRSLRGKYKHLPLMETLAEDRKRERES